MAVAQPLYRGTCKNCGDTFDTTNPDRHYCAVHAPRGCSNCGELFEPEFMDDMLCADCDYEYYMNEVCHRCDGSGYVPTTPLDPGHYDMRTPMEKTCPECFGDGRQH